MYKLSPTRLPTVAEWAEAGRHFLASENEMLLDPTFADPLVSSDWSLRVNTAPADLINGVELMRRENENRMP